MAPAIDLHDARKIAVLRASKLGDFLTAVPGLRALRAACPDAEVTYIGLPNNPALLGRFPAYVDRQVAFPGYPGMRDRLPNPRRVLRFLTDAQRAPYDLVLQIAGSGIFMNPFATLLGARATVGFIRAEDSPRHMGLDHFLVWREEQHQVLKILDLLETIGVAPLGTEQEFPVFPTDQTEFHAVLNNHGVDGDRPLIGIHPGGRALDRRWPAARFASVADALAQRIEATLVLTGDAGDARYTHDVQDRMRHTTVNLAGMLTLGAFAALLTRLTLFVTNDTGAAHLAYALGVPSVTIFGIGRPEEWGPLDTTRHRVVVPPRHEVPRGAQPGIRAIPTDAVLAEVWRALGGADAPRHRSA